MPNDSISTEAKDVARVWALMEKVRVCMLATWDGAAIRTRPMSATPREGENAIYFLTDAKTQKTEEVEHDETVSLAFADPGDGKYVNISGHARLLDDRALIRDLWTIAAQAWWEGPEDPSIRVIEVTPEDAEYWEGPGGVGAMVRMAAAAALHLRPDLGENRKVDLS